MERLTTTGIKGDVALTFDLFFDAKPSEAQKILKLARKLKEYEDAEEQGKIIKLPCKVGDEIYRVYTYEGYTQEWVEVFTVKNILFHEDGSISFRNDNHDDIICELENIVTGSLYLGCYKIFLSKEEAENFRVKKQQEDRK